MDGKNGMVKLKICVERRSVWFMTTAREMSGFDALLGNVLSQLGCMFLGPIKRSWNGIVLGNGRDQ
jgi:hypothetical protein